MSNNDNTLDRQANMLPWEVWMKVLELIFVSGVSRVIHTEGKVFSVTLYSQRESKQQEGEN